MYLMIIWTHCVHTIPFNFLYCVTAVGLVLGHDVGLDGNDMAIDWVMIFFFLHGG